MPFVLEADKTCRVVGGVGKQFIISFDSLYNTYEEIL